MYTHMMKSAVRSLDAYCPKGFGIEILDNGQFITIRAKERSFMALLDEDKRRAVEYLAKVKNALELNGAIVLIVREGGKEV